MRLKRVLKKNDDKLSSEDKSMINEKLENLYQFYKQAMPLKGWQTYSDISLKYSNQIVCTKKKPKN